MIEINETILETKEFDNKHDKEIFKDNAAMDLMKIGYIKGFKDGYKQREYDLLQDNGPRDTLCQV